MFWQQAQTWDGIALASFKIYRFKMTTDLRFASLLFDEAYYPYPAAFPNVQFSCHVAGANLLSLLLLTMIMFHARVADSAQSLLCPDPSILIWEFLAWAISQFYLKCLTPVTLGT